MTVRDVNYDWAYPLTPRQETGDLILHHAGGDGGPQELHRIHLGNGWSGMAYHYYVRKDGSVYRGRPENMQGGHCKGCNDRAIGVCFEGNFETQTMSPAQKAAGLALVADIKSRYPGIIVGGHRDYAATACPGRNFPLQEMKEAKVPDNTPDTYAVEAVAWAREQGILKGDDTGNLRLHEAVSRQDLLVLLHRCVGGESG